MQGTITSRFWPPLPRLRVTLERFWMIGDHGFWVARLRERHEWVGPWYGSRRDYEAIGWSVAGDVAGDGVLMLEATDGTVADMR